MFKKITLGLSAFMPLAAFAQTAITGGAGGIKAPTDAIKEGQVLDIKIIIDNIIGWVSGILIAVSVLFVIFAAYLYLTSAGDAEKVKSASSYILYAVIAVVVALAARGILALGSMIGGF